MEYPLNAADNGNLSTQTKHCPGATLSTTNPTWTGTELNTGLRCDRQATNRLNRSRNSCIAKVFYKFLSSTTHTLSLPWPGGSPRKLSEGLAVVLYQHCLSEGMLSCINTACLKECCAVSTLPVWRNVELYQHCLSEGMLSCINTACLKECWAVSSLPVWRNGVLYQHCLSEGMLNCINTARLKVNS